MYSQSALSNGRGPRISGALLRSGLWLRGGVIGAGAAILGVMLLISGETSLARGLVLVAGGAVLAIHALRRSWRLLDSEGGATAPASKRSAPAAARALSFDRPH